MVKSIFHICLVLMLYPSFTNSMYRGSKYLRRTNQQFTFIQHYLLSGMRSCFSSGKSNEVKFFKGPIISSELKGKELEEYSTYKDACRIFLETQEHIEKLSSLGSFSVGDKKVHCYSENVPLLAYIHTLLQKNKSQE